MSDDIPDTDVVVRHCSSGQTRNRRVLPKAFYLREGETYTSVNGLEKAYRAYGGPSVIESVRIALRRKRSLGTKDILAELNVGDAKRVVRELVGTDVLRVEHKPTNIDISHASMSGYGKNNLGSNELYKDVAAELALLASDRTHPAVV